ncbi:hypothetical protein EVAR_97281_1 [Eumeta japonica]|uniref:Uncharacterized protein n=1 Tax=Eumeta variegata TaxID=151549 RepID=A0A4C1XHR5_EUMVA|nr:hypothetical protein EVAR_97281_1 [Eumeta japonica]
MCERAPPPHSAARCEMCKQMQPRPAAVVDLTLYSSGSEHVHCAVKKLLPALDRFYGGPPSRADRSRRRASISTRVDVAISRDSLSDRLRRSRFAYRASRHFIRLQKQRDITPINRREVIQRETIPTTSSGRRGVRPIVVPRRVAFKTDARTLFIYTTADELTNFSLHAHLSPRAGGRRPQHKLHPHMAGSTAPALYFDTF